MGFLEGLGRSRAITGTLSAIDQLKANEQARAINAQNIQFNEIDLKARQYQQQQIAQQEEMNNRILPLSAYFPNMESGSGMEKWATETARGMGILEEHPVAGVGIKYGNFQRAAEMFKQSKEMQSEFLSSAVTDFTNKRNGLKQKIEELKADPKTKPEELVPLQKQLSDTEMMLSQAWTGLSMADKELRKKMLEQQLGIPTGTPKNKQLFKDPNGRTVLVDTSLPDAQDMIDKGQLTPIQEKIALERIPAQSTGTLPPGVSFNRRTGKYSFNGNELSGQEVQDMLYGEGGTIEKRSQAVMRGGATTANVTAASKMYNQEYPELIKLRQKVQAKGLLPTGQLKDMEAINQWLGMKTSDPDTALLKKKTMFLADSLMRVMGSSQGGEWAFKVAADILDPSLAPDAFSAIMKSHGIAMERMAKARQEFGQPIQPPILEGEEGEEQQTTEQYETGKIYTDDKGRKAKYLGGGRWQLQ